MLAAGATVPRMHNSGEGIEDDGNDATMPPHSWSSINPEKFLVRQGPDYAVRKQKARSVGPSLFRLHAVDWYKAGKRLAKAGGLVQLPKAEFSHPLVPSLLIVNVQLPLEGPNLMKKGSNQDGPTLHAVFYFSLREETVRALDNLESATPSVRLLANYFRRAETEPAVRKRFKALAVVNNLDAIKMQRLVGPFNGKPVLITESGSLVRGLRTPTGEAAFERGEGGAKTMAHATESGSGETNSGGGDAGRALEGSGASGCFSPDEFLEMDVNVRQWSFLARKGLHKLEPKFGLMNISVGFLIEGRQDDELPEQLLGCGALNMLDMVKARDVQA